MDRGMTPTAAREAAGRHVGNRTMIEESTREAWMFNRIEALLHDLRYGLRLLRRSPGFTVTAVLVISLGVGANTAAFTLARSRPDPALAFRPSRSTGDAVRDATGKRRPAHPDLSAEFPRLAGDEPELRVDGRVYLGLLSGESLRPG